MRRWKERRQIRRELLLSEVALQQEMGRVLQRYLARQRFLERKLRRLR